MATPLDAVEKALQSVTDRLQAMPEALKSEESMQALIKSVCSELFNDMIKDPNGEIARNIRFQKGDPRLAGSKFAKFGMSTADVELLHQIQTSLVGAKRVSGGSVYGGPSEELENAFKAVSAAQYMSDEDLRKLSLNQLDAEFSRVPKYAFHGNDAALVAKGRWQETAAYLDAVKAMDTAESGYGQQLVGVEYVPALWDAARRDSVIFSQIDSFEMTAPSAYLPVEADLPEMLFVAENTSASWPSNLYTTVKTGSNRVSVAAKKFVFHQIWSGELEEDALIPFIPYLKMQIQKALAHYSDSLVLNGDTTNAGSGNINLVDADPADTKHYLAFDGIRHAALVDNTANTADAAGVPTWAMLLAPRARMMDRTNLIDWGHPTDPADLVYAVDPETGDAMAANISELLTLNNYGKDAVVLMGEVAKVGRHPLLSTIALSKTDATGNVSTTGNNNTKGQIVAFNKRAFKVGWRRHVKVEADRLIGNDQSRLVFSMRLGLGRYSPTGAASGIEAADVTYNVTV